MPGGPVMIAEQDNAVRHGHRHIAPHHVGRGGGHAERAQVVEHAVGDGPLLPRGARERGQLEEE